MNIFTLNGNRTRRRYDKARAKTKKRLINEIESSRSEINWIESNEKTELKLLTSSTPPIMIANIELTEIPSNKILATITGSPQLYGKEQIQNLLAIQCFHHYFSKRTFTSHSPSSIAFSTISGKYSCSIASFHVSSSKPSSISSSLNKSPFSIII